jgi:fatty-acyl-CoA synthase
MGWYRKRTLGGILQEAATRWGEREAFSFNGERWTYTQFNDETNRVAKALIALGVQPGEHVALWMTNRPEWLFLMFAIARVGGCIVPLNTRYRTDDVAYTVTQSRSGTLISLDRSGPVDYQGMLMESMPSIEQAADGLKVENYPDLKRLVVLGELRLPNATGWEAFIAAGASISDDTLTARADAVDPDSLMMLAYTSGTTGNPKGVMHSHQPSAPRMSGRR